MRLDLNTAYFKTKIIEASSGKLAGNDVFKNTLEDCILKWRNWKQPFIGG
jgi:hypothetical protein